MSAIAFSHSDRNHVTMPAETIRPGDRVHDQDDPDPNDAIVVTLPPLTATEWDVESRDCTLADDNPDYPDDAAVAVVCFVDDLLEYGPPFDPTEQNELSVATLNESGVHYYTFPVPRLTVLESPATGIETAEPTTQSEESTPTATSSATDDDADTDPDHATEQTADETDDEDDRKADTGPSPELTQLKTTLEDEGLAATVEGDETITVERLGQTYRIRPGEEIEGDGALRSQLEAIVADAI
jgi:hypothetical protein